MPGLFQDLEGLFNTCLQRHRVLATTPQSKCHALSRFVTAPNLDALNQLLQRLLQHHARQLRGIRALHDLVAVVSTQTGLTSQNE